MKTVRLRISWKNFNRFLKVGQVVFTFYYIAINVYICHRMRFGNNKSLSENIMKLRNLFLCLLVAGAAVAGCKKEEGPGELKLELSETELSFESAAGDKQIILAATRNWRVQNENALSDWIAVDPMSGESAPDGTPVTVSVLENKGKNREASIYFTIGTLRKTLTISQAGEDGGDVQTGDGTAESPYTVADAQALIETLAPDVSSDEVYIKGIVSEIREVSTSFGNATYSISDDGTTTGQLLVYRGYWLDGAKFTSESQIKVGDKVVVVGTVVNFKGDTPEVNQGNKLVSVNGQGGGTVTPDPVGNPEGDGTEASPYNVAATQAAAAKLAAGETTGDVYIKGKVSTIQEISTQFGNATYFISDDGTKSGEFEVFRGYYLSGEKFVSEDQLKVGDELVIRGKLTNYNGTLEVATGSEIISLNGSTQDNAKRFSVSTTDLKVSAEAESATFKVNGNVEWKAEVTEGADWGVKILSGESGNGAGDVVLELTKNESEENARTAKITVTTTADVATGTYEVVLTQAKKSSGEVGEGTPVTWTLGENAYDNTSAGNNQQSATINGEERTDLLKLGTGKKTGSAVLHIPAGTKKVAFYGVCWRGKKASIKCSVGGTVFGTQELAANEGATGNAPYTVTVTESDHYEITVPIELTADTDVTVESVQGSDPRAILFGIVAYR